MRALKVAMAITTTMSMMMMVVTIGVRLQKTIDALKTRSTWTRRILLPSPLDESAFSQTLSTNSA